MSRVALPRLQEPRPVPAQSVATDARAPAVAFAESAGNRLADIDFASLQTREISHGLQRVPVGWRVIDATVNVPELVRLSWDQLRLTLQHTGPAATRVTLWVW